LRRNGQRPVATRGDFPGDGKQAGILFLDIQQRGTDFIGVGRHCRIKPEQKNKGKK